MDLQEIRAARNGFIARAAGERTRNAATRTIAPIRGEGNPNEVREMMRLIDGRPYIPGSSVKGAIRTAFLNAIAGGVDAPAFAHPAVSGVLNRIPDGGDRQKGVANGMEEFAFGVDVRGSAGEAAPIQNRDMNRAFRVSDFEPLGSVPVAFTSVAAYRLSGEAAGAKIPIWCEAILPGARFRGVVTFELNGSAWEAASRDSDGRGALLDHFFETWASGGRRLARLEAANWLSGFDPGVTAFYEKMAAQPQPMMLGWGGGWLSKTVGPVLDQARTQRVVGAFNLQRMPRGAAPPANGKFPLTRRLAATASGLLPPGWLTFAAKRQL
jgi:CRISPR-associated protein Csm5